MRHSPTLLLSLLPLFALGCREEGDPKYATDADQDGVRSDQDCDDQDAGVGAPSTWYADADADGYGAADGDTSCTPPASAAAEGGDCDDADPAVHPAATETCDGADQDCDGTVDNGFTVATWYADTDGDGYGDDNSTQETCLPPDDAVETGGDCDDQDAAIHPGAAEPDCTDPRDYNCDGSTGYADLDADGFPACEECDDTDAGAFPGAAEECDGTDDDCDGDVDEDAVDASTFYADLDGDGYGDPAAPVSGCEAPAGAVADATDCDDGASAVHPDADEYCDGVDQDCDGEADNDAVDAPTWYVDLDTDGYGDSSAPTSVSCESVGGAAVGGDCDDQNPAYNPGVVETDCDDPQDYNCDGSVGFADADADGYAACAECDDGNAAISPLALEICDGVDNDCDGALDEEDAADAASWYADADADGYGSAGVVATGCAAPAGYVADATDCDDADAAVSPDRTELCNDVDDDCDGVQDEADAADASAWYIDADGDSHGDPLRASVVCEAPAGTVADSSDCDDTRSDIHIGAVETCDGDDNDCDAAVDEADAIDSNTWYADQDGDGYGDSAGGTPACDAPTDHVADGSDCDDTRSDVNPTGTETCDGIDNDCDGDTDEADAIDISVWYADADADGYGDLSVLIAACTQPAGAVADHRDCDDSHAESYPRAPEICDGLDNDCDGSTDEGAAAASTWYRDRDGDTYGDAGFTLAACTQPSGYVSDDADCDDGDLDVHPGAAEHCDEQDEDCDGEIDEIAEVVDATVWFPDADGDGYGDDYTATAACDAPADWVDDDTDCDDTSDRVNPAAEDVCDGVDNDCDGTTDPDPEPYDADGDGVENCLDNTIYSYNFDDGAFTGWTIADLGGGNSSVWSMSGGTLREASNAAVSVVVGPDLGPLYAYTIDVEVYSGGAANNGAAIAFGYVDASNYYLARWLDPNDYYGYYTAGQLGQMDVYRCVAGSCSVLATDDGTQDLHTGYGVWADLSVTVDDGDIAVSLGGVEVVNTTVASFPVGANRVGVWTFDNDSTIAYDNFVVTGP